MVCSNCGRFLIATDDYCAHCSAAVDTNPQPGKAGRILRILGRRRKKATGRFPLQTVADAMKLGGVEDVSLGETSVSFRSGGGFTKISVRGDDHSAADGARVQEIVSVSSALPKDLESVSEEQVAVINIIAGLSAVVRDSESGRLAVESRVSLYAGDKDAIRLHVHLVLLAASLQLDWLAAAFLHVCDQEAHIPRLLALPGREDSSPWGADFGAVDHQMRNRGLACSGDAGGVTVEFPWGDNTSTSSHDGRTSLLTLDSTSRHPFLGNGLFMKLELPVQFPQSIVAAMSNILNIAEMGAVDAVPMYGAWCSKIDSERLAFVCFCPNIGYFPGLAANFAVWMMHRSTAAWAVLQSLQRSGSQ